MSHLRAVVQNGRIILNEPTALPEGTVLNLVLDDEGDNLDVNERDRLRAAIREGLAEAAAGHVISADDFLADIRRSR
jgi:hypothetical protein